MKATSITYFITRDSHAGQLADKCDLWWMKPLRVRAGDRVTWLHKDGVSGHLGEHEVRQITEWFRVYPETDRELIIVEQGKTE